jgi:flagellar hook-length control protein FliK
MNPEALGKLRVQLSVDGANIAARFEATSEATKQLLSQNVDALRGALEARGLKVTSLEVAAIPDWSVKANNDQQLPPGTKTEDNPGSFQQHTGQDFSQSGNQSGDPHGRNHPELSSAKFDWLREPDQAPAATPRADAAANLRTDSRLIGLNARLELDAVA